MTPAELERAVDQKQIPPLLYLYGEERFTLERLLKKLIHVTIPEDSRDFNLTVFHPKEYAPEKVIETARTYPLFCSHRLLLIKDAHQISAADLDALLPYLHDPAPETLLVFVGDKIDARRKFFLDFKKHGDLVEFKKLYDNQLPAAIRELARNEDLTLTDEALALFCRRIGTSLQDAHSELVKLAAYVGTRKLADVVDIEAVVSGTRQETVFALNDAVGERHARRAVELVGRLLDEGTPALVVLSMLVKHFRNLCKIRELVEQNRPRGEMAKVAAVNPYFLDGLIRQSRNFPPRRYRQIFALFLDVDLSLKSAASVHPEVLLERVVLDICGDISRNR